MKRIPIRDKYGYLQFEVEIDTATNEIILNDGREHFTFDITEATQLIKALRVAYEELGKGAC